MTTQQVRDRTKTVTRRLGWWFLKHGDRVRAVRKAMGLRKGEKTEHLAIIEVVSTQTEPLCFITKDDCVKEGFPDFEPRDFINMLCDHYNVHQDITVNRIEFKYID